MQILTFPRDRMRGQALAMALGAISDLIDLHHFPDGESRLRLPPTLSQRVVMLRSLNQPNEKLVELLMVRVITCMQRLRS